MEYLKALMMFLGVATVSFVLFYLMLKQKNSNSVAIAESKDKGELKKLKQELKADKWSWQNVMMSKWVDFGGGFYGVMAVFTYLIVEFKEVVDLLTSEASMIDTISQLGVADLVGFFVNSLMNFITAIVWPAYWLNETAGLSVWVWFLIVYFAYACGQFLAKNLRNPYAKDV